MKKILFFVLVLFLCLNSKAFCHPPTNIKLTYDSDSKILHIQMKHATNNVHRDCIRKLVVSKNSSEIVTKNYNIQSDFNEFSEDVSVDVKEGEKLSIVAYSRKGGTGSASITVEKKEEKKDAQVQEKKVIESKEDLPVDTGKSLMDKALEAKTKEMNKVKKSEY